MARYAIGDIQGCYTRLINLLNKIQFNHGTDTLYLVGDLVNRGPESLQVLEWVYNHQSSVRTVLGNHDIYLIARYYNILKADSDETISDILYSPDAEKLILYLRHCPIVLELDDYLIAHAGIYPKLPIQKTLEINNYIQEMLLSDNYLSFIKHVYGNKPNYWSDEHIKLNQMKFIINSSTRMRYLDSYDFSLQYKYKGEILNKPSNLIPWFKTDFDPSINKKIIFGHWAALGFYHNNKVVSLDTGCVWGRLLTVFNLDTYEIIQT
jgi:bis(5'-nucleosyl)-tetraphosphatase (symmetrical)